MSTLLRGRWTRAQWSRIIGGAGGILGLLGLALPWAVFYETGDGPVTLWGKVTFHATAWQLLNLGSPSGVPVYTALVPTLEAAWTFDLIWIGALVVGAGAVLSIVRPVAGLITVAGALMAIAGAETTSAIAHLPMGYVSVTLAPDAGMFIGLAGGILAVTGWATTRTSPRRRSWRLRRPRRGAVTVPPRAP